MATPIARKRKKQDEEPEPEVTTPPMQLDGDKYLRRLKSRFSNNIAQLQDELAMTETMLEQMQEENEALKEYIASLPAPEPEEEEGEGEEADPEAPLEAAVVEATPEPPAPVAPTPPPPPPAPPVEEDGATDLTPMIV